MHVSSTMKTALSPFPEIDDFLFGVVVSGPCIPSNPKPEQASSRTGSSLPSISPLSAPHTAADTSFPCFRQSRPSSYAACSWFGLRSAQRFADRRLLVAVARRGCRCSSRGGGSMASEALTVTSMPAVALELARSPDISVVIFPQPRIRAAAAEVRVRLPESVVCIAGLPAPAPAFDAARITPPDRTLAHAPCYKRTGGSIRPHLGPRIMSMSIAQTVALARAHRAFSCCSWPVPLAKPRGVPIPAHRTSTCAYLLACLPAAAANSNAMHCVHVPVPVWPLADMRVRLGQAAPFGGPHRPADFSETGNVNLEMKL
ncbi:hypothetical protein EVG20_g6174 [Dentipellis fragilis]|uniref:Uncharacterized protein n=1 Tax=Dentipellis fragilis TaxID=205917 RepID=A0A4Y9YPK9_9AGAM|nr:hypothetical protein EVG20_g6174 [Dentipellis fragilis]